MGREIRRTPAGWDWPLKKTWEGFLTPKRLHERQCDTCGGHSYSPRARHLSDLFYGYVPFHPMSTGSRPFGHTHPVIRGMAERNISNAPEYYGMGESAILREAMRLAHQCFDNHWSHHLSQDDVDILLAEGLPYDLHRRFDPESGAFEPVTPPKMTAAEFNEWNMQQGSLSGVGSSELWVLQKAICGREGVPYVCTTCDGHGTVEVYPGQRAEAEAWEPTDPPTGDGWQVWETTSEGSPISPSFATKEEVILWLMSDAFNYGVSRPLSREQAERFVEAAWAPTLIANATGLHDGASQM